MTTSLPVNWSDTNTSIKLEAAVENAVTNASGPLISPESINAIIQQLIDGLGKDVVTQAETEAIKRTLDRLVHSGKIPAERAAEYSNQIKKGIQDAVDKNALKVEEGAKEWVKFSANAGDDTIRKMAEEAAGDKHTGWFWGKRISDEETRKMLTEASKDGTVSLSEINSMYKGIDDAFKSGAITAAERQQAVRDLDHSLRRMTGSFLGEFKGALSPEAKDFVKFMTGGNHQSLFGAIGDHDDGAFGWFGMHNSHATHDIRDIQGYCEAITKDGVVSKEERAALVNLMFRDGNATTAEIQAIRDALTKAVSAGTIKQAEFDGTMKLIQVEAAKYAGSSLTVGDWAQQMNIQNTGSAIFKG